MVARPRVSMNRLQGRPLTLRLSVERDILLPVAATIHFEDAVELRIHCYLNSYRHLVITPS